ncbi:MAG: pirin family protein [Bacteroidetes bacterium]|nr:MAG: pirin family protein [Bacteroidota bacterium]
MEKRYKSIDSILAPPHFHMVGDGFRVHNFFPSQPEIGLDGMSPFFLMDYGAKWNVPPSDTPKGVGVHPHRGFETVTIAYHGKVAHHDSAGNSGVIGEGDVQWMTAGAGVLHKEYHEKEFSRKGGVFQMVQLWVNLPEKYKMTPAKYQTIENKDMAKFLLDDGNSFVEIIAGEYNSMKGTASTFSPVNLFNAKLIPGSKAGFNFNKNHNTGMLVIEGEVKINNLKTAPENYFILFGHDGEDIAIEAVKKSVVLILSGEPLNEPIASNGPFVMNTESEIKQAYNDFYNGKFGYLED